MRWYSRVLIIAMWHLLQSVAGRTFSMLNSLLRWVNLGVWILLHATCLR